MPARRRPATRSVVAAEAYERRLKLTDVIGFVAQNGYAREANACAGLNRETWRCIPAGLSASDADRVRRDHPLWQAIIDLQHRYGTRLIFAARTGRLARVRELCDWRADVNAALASPPGPPGGWTALHYASRFGEMDCLRELIRHGADVNARDHVGMTPLMVSCFYRENRPAEDGGRSLAGIARALLAAGADKRLRSLADGTGSTARNFAQTISHSALGLADAPDPRYLRSEFVALLDAAP